MSTVSELSTLRNQLFHETPEVVDDNALPNKVLLTLKTPEEPTNKSLFYQKQEMGANDPLQVFTYRCTSCYQPVLLKRADDVMCSNPQCYSRQVVKLKRPGFTYSVCC
jgi:DNA-directed RNA polymerase subunit RPC12/RpoP